jgi:hypothetical protein
VLRSISHELAHAKKYLMESAGLIHGRMPCMAVASVEVSKTASLECCPLHEEEEDANAEPASVDR